MPLPLRRSTGSSRLVLCTPLWASSSPGPVLPCHSPPRKVRAIAEVTPPLFKTDPPKTRHIPCPPPSPGEKCRTEDLPLYLSPPWPPPRAVAHFLFERNWERFLSAPAAAWFGLFLGILSRFPIPVRICALQQPQ